MIATPVPAEASGLSSSTSRRDEILLAAAKAFAENGFRNTDVQVIADQLGIGKGTIYRAFPTKKDLFLACVDHSMRGLQDSIQDATYHLDDPVEKIKEAIRAYFRYYDDHQELIELIIQERSEFKDRPKPTYFEHRDCNVKPWNDLFAMLASQSKIRNLPPEKITDHISQQLYGKLFTYYFQRKKGSMAAEADEVIDLIFFGIHAEPQT